MTRKEYAEDQRQYYFHLWLSAPGGTDAERRYRKAYKRWDQLIGFFDYMKGTQ